MAVGDAAMRDAVVSHPDFGAAVPTRELRADARRNRDRLLAVATEAYETRGVDVTFDEIARAARVGIGTLYRHFPTRLSLIEAVYAREVDLLTASVDGLRASRAPLDALTGWLQIFVEHVLARRGMAVAIKEAVGVDSACFADARRKIVGAVDLLLADCAAAGLIRTDIEAVDLLRALGGMCLATPADPTSSERAARVVSVFVDGLRYGR